MTDFVRQFIKLPLINFELVSRSGSMSSAFSSARLVPRSFSRSSSLGLPRALVAKASLGAASSSTLSLLGTIDGRMLSLGGVREPCREGRWLFWPSLKRRKCALHDPCREKEGKKKTKMQTGHRKEQPGVSSEVEVGYR